MVRRRVLISAFAFSPYRGSECAIGWNMVTRLAQVHDVTVICGDVKGTKDTQRELSAYFQSHAQIPHLTICYVAPGRLVTLCEKIHRIPGCWAVYYLAYNLWQRKAYRIAQELHAKHAFDLVHQLTMQGFREPGYLWRLPIPFFWGPVGGNADEPLAYLPLLSMRGRVQVVVRKLCNCIQRRWQWRPRQAARRAQTVWVSTPADQRCAIDFWNTTAIPMLDAGAESTVGRKPHAWDGKTPLRLVWSGIFFPRKALPILLHAIARLDPHERARVELHVLGDGSEQRNWQRLANQLALQQNVVWEGFVQLEKAHAIMDTCHVCAITSIKEAASVVTLEALSLGLPVICHDACGMGLAITDGCGVKIPMRDPETSIQGFGQAIREFLQHAELVQKLSHGALKRAEELSWDQKAAAIARTYETIPLLL